MTRQAWSASEGRSGQATRARRRREEEARGRLSARGGEVPLAAGGRARLPAMPQDRAPGRTVPNRRTMLLGAAAWPYRGRRVQQALRGGRGGVSHAPRWLTAASRPPAEGQPLLRGRHCQRVRRALRRRALLTQCLSLPVSWASSSTLSTPCSAAASSTSCEHAGDAVRRGAARGCSHACTACTGGSQPGQHRAVGRQGGLAAGIIVISVGCIFLLLRCTTLAVDFRHGAH